MNDNVRRPTEDSVVLSIRDWQWRRILAIGEDRPDILVRIGKSAEKFMGDLIFEDETLFYLLEVKANSDAIEDEWMEFVLPRRATNAPRQRKSQPKSAITTLTGALADLANASHDFAFGHNEQTIEQSLRCHHFAYWSDPKATEPHVANQVWIAPYFSTVYRRGGISDDKAIRNGLGILGKYDFAIDVSSYIAPDRQEVQASPANFSTLDMLHARRLVITCEAGIKEDSGLRWRPLGLPIRDFHSYVKFMCRNKSIAMNTVVMASNGASSNCAFRTSELEAFVDDLAKRINDQKISPDTEWMEKLQAKAVRATSSQPASTPGSTPRPKG